MKQIGVEHLVKETYFSALELGCLALLRLGIDEARAEKLRKTSIQTENATVEGMYQSWVSSDDSGMSPGYRELFMQQEVAISDAMEDHQLSEDKQ